MKSAVTLTVVVCVSKKKVTMTDCYYTNKHTPLSILSFTKVFAQEGALKLSNLKRKPAI